MTLVGTKLKCVANGNEKDSCLFKTLFHTEYSTFPFVLGRIGRDVDFPMSVSTEPITLNADANGEVTQVNVITGVTIVTPWYIRMTWFLYDLALTNCGLLTLLYWPLVYNGRLTDTKLCNNALNTILLFSDVMVTRVPIRVLHVVYPALFFLLYVLFNVGYSFLGLQDIDQSEARIYSVLDWRRPMLPSAGVCVIIVLLMPMIQFGWYLLYQLRLYLWRRYGQEG